MGKLRAISLFFLLMIIYFIIRYLRIDSESIFLKYYATDLLFVPTTCFLGLFFVRWLKRDDMLQVPYYQVILLVFGLSFYFEYYLPNYKSKPGWYTQDIWDVLMYVIGGLLFMIYQVAEHRYVQRKN